MVLHKGETRHCPKHVAGVTSLLLRSCLPHFMEGQLSPREGEWLAQSHTAG